MWTYLSLAGEKKSKYLIELTNEQVEWSQSFSSQNVSKIDISLILVTIENLGCAS